ncbi:hypothetical protein HNQ75_004045 [Rhizobium flavum]|uniref:Uncharacterized protein n=1 Tax=Pseudorhizobium flavum TaxID=1335061 RepID=A0A7W9Z2N7_9HYPH|nr:hypothetical protein [Pseudorhizobium flavum]CAD6632118.1 hypothetical protein RFYW14_04609 [Pseudorhizobium flavum]
MGATLATSVVAIGVDYSPGGAVAQKRQYIYEALAVSGYLNRSRK